jgi:hypothetical protein
VRVWQFFRCGAPVRPKVVLMRIWPVAVLVLSVALSGSALAAKLDPVACDALKAERARVATDALKSDMMKGPEWAKANLSAERLKEIEQLIGLEEGIAFRCPVPKPPPAAASVAKAGEDGKKQAAKTSDGKSGDDAADTNNPGKDEDQEKAKAAPNKETKPAVAKKQKNQSGNGASKQAAKPVDAPATKPVEGSGSKSERQPLGKPAAGSTKSKPKVSDAYVPPPKDALSFGFASDMPAALPPATPPQAAAPPAPSAPAPAAATGSQALSP